MLTPISRFLCTSLSNRSTPAVSRSPVAAGLEGRTSGRGRGRTAGRREATPQVLNSELPPPPPASRQARKGNRGAATEQARSKRGLGSRSVPSKADGKTTLALASAVVSQAAPSRRGERVVAEQVRGRESYGMGMLPENICPLFDPYLARVRSQTFPAGASKGVPSLVGYLHLRRYFPPPEPPIPMITTFIPLLFRPHPNEDKKDEGKRNLHKG